VENKRKNILLVVVSIAAILVIGVFFVLWNPTPPPVVPMPVPNGYAAFVQAGTLVQKQTWDFTKMDEVQLRSLVEANSNALQTARSGLAEKSRVPMEFSQPYVSAHMQDLAQLKTLAEAFLAEGRLAELEKRTNNTAQAYVDAARLGIDSRQGGNVIDGLVGIAVEAMGTFSLQQLVPNLDAKTSAELARQLEAVNSNEESWMQIRENEKNWSRRTFPGLQYRLAAFLRRNATKAEDAKTEKKFNAQQNRMRRLMLDLAAHAYQLDKGHHPANVADLVPDYLKAAPVDPLTGKQMTLTP
jgi:hypothetical protein